MAEPFASYSADNDMRFRNALRAAAESVKDLTIPLTLISKDFFKSEMAIFNLSGPGLYPDLAPSTKKDRIRRGQPIYPILVRNGALKNALTDPADSNSVNVIIGGLTLVLGTKLPYLAFHQSDRPRNKIPLRKALFIGPEARRFAVGDQVGRLERWLGILDGFMAQKLTFGKYTPGKTVT